MNYELSKKLKDAGFPQVPTMDMDVYVESDESLCHYWNRVEMSACKVPTLEELIEATQVELIVKRSPTVNPFWQAYKENGQPLSADGSTPTEAVANLYLALSEPQI